MTSSERKERNEHYGKLNARFDVREKYLRNMGYKRETNEELNLAFYVKRSPGFKPHALTASCVLMADDVVWADTCREIENRI